MVDVAKNFAVKSALFGRTPPRDPDFAELLAVLDRKRTPIVMIGRGDSLDIGGVSVEVLYPFMTADENEPSDNNNSVVLRIVYGSRAILLTGDIERTAETALVANGGTLAADLIRVPHHGSRTSSTQEFIDATHAQYAIISVGRSSLFGHPHLDVVERWKLSGATVMTTGQRGTISVSTDGKDLKIATFQQ